MLIRALIVLLLVLNLGVAAWWHWSTPATPQPTVQVPPHVGQLQLVREREANAASATAAPATSGSARVAAPVDAAAAATATSVPPAAGPANVDPLDRAPGCYSYGPFDSEDTLVAAQATLKPLTEALSVRRIPLRAGRGWRVYLPPLANAEEASAVAGRISAAGFRDYFIVREGAEAHSVALGRFGSESAARRHADALNAAGFAVRAEPLGAGTGVAWVDVRAGADFDAAAARAQVGAGQVRSADCATLR